MATNLIAYTTLTIKAADGTDVRIWAEAEKTSLEKGESTKIYVYTDPISYLDSVVGQITDGRLVDNGVKTFTQDKEDVTLTKQNTNSLAEGNLKYPPVSGVNIEVLAVIGVYSGVNVSGSTLQATALGTDAAVLRCKYSYKARQFTYTASLNPIADKVICMWSLNG